MKGRWKEPAIVLTLMGVLSIPLWRPLFHEGLFFSHDSLSNLLRTSALFHTLSEKFGYVRWFKDFSYGYGYPFLNFYAPLTYYVMSFFHLLGFTFTASAKLLIITQSLLRGFSMYYLCRQTFEKPESFLSGVAFIYTPYFICDVYVRGDLSESLSFSLLPLAILFFQRLIVTGKMKYLACASITYSLLILSHNCLSLPFSAVIFAYILVFGFQNRRSLYNALLAFALGIALSTIFWLPALAEMKYVHLERVVGEKFFYARHFKLRELISSRWGFGRNIHDPMPLGIGLPHIFAFLSSILLVRKARGRRRLAVTFFISLALAGTFLITPFSRKLWETLPLIRFLQFPWRLLSVTAFGTSFLFASFGLIPGRKRDILCLGLLIIIVAFYGRYARVYKYLPTTDTDLRPSKISSVDNTTTYSDEYLPLWVKEKPSKKSGCVTVTKGDGSVLELSRHGADYDFSVLASEGTEVILNSYWYPGWRLWIDGAEAPISINSNDGRICFSVPAGRHRILVRFLDTRLRAAAKLISLFSLISLILLVILSAKYQVPGTKKTLVN